MDAGRGKFLKLYRTTEYFLINFLKHFDFPN
jgi:hypothetical protein